jgi:hypothetical protein
MDGFCSQPDYIMQRLRCINRVLCGQIVADDNGSQTLW